MMPHAAPPNQFFRSLLTDYGQVLNVQWLLNPGELRICVNIFIDSCCSKVNLTGVNGKVNMSGCKDDNPDNERRETINDC